MRPNFVLAILAGSLVIAPSVVGISPIAIAAGPASIVRLENIPLPNLGMVPEYGVSALACAVRGPGCMLVGDYADRNQVERSFVDVETDGQWRSMPVPPTFQADTLKCQAISFCVGFVKSDTPTTLWIDRDGTWRAKSPTISISGVIYPVELQAVSCPQTGPCRAVGSATPAGSRNELPVVVALGARGFISSLALPMDGFATVNVTAVSCPTATRCGAAALASPNPASNNAAETLVMYSLEAGKWIVATYSGCTNNCWTPPTGIACPAKGDCLVTASDSPGWPNAIVSGWADSWTGTTWGQISADIQLLAAPACTASSACSAVGVAVSWLPGNRAVGRYVTVRRIAGRWVVKSQPGYTWNPVNTKPTPPRLAHFTGSYMSQACRDSGGCARLWSIALLVGLAGRQDHSLLSYGSVQWRRTFAWNPGVTPPYASSSLNSVACPAIGACVAIGERNVGNNSVALVVELAGGKWKPASVPYPEGVLHVVGTTYEKLSCPSTGSCVAVGFERDRLWARDQSDYVGAFVVSSLASGQWRTDIIHPPAWLVPYGSVGISSLVCDSISFCVAGVNLLNGKTGNLDPLFLQESNHHWTLERVPLPGDTEPNSLQAVGPVACVRVSLCLSLGRYSGANNAAFADGGSPRRWKTSTVVPPPSPPQIDYWELSPSNLVCLRGECWGLAVQGYVQNYPRYQRAVVIHFDGNSWSTRLAPLPAAAHGSTFAQLSSLSCVPSGSCEAVGYYTGPSGSGSNYPLLLSEVKGVWAADPAPPAPIATPDSISCVGNGQCTGIGFEPSSPSTTSFTVYRLRLGSKIMAKGETVPGNLYGAQIDCSSASGCLATGNGSSVLWITPTAVKAVPLSAALSGQSILGTADSTCVASGPCYVLGNVTSLKTGAPSPVFGVLGSG